MKILPTVTLIVAVMSLVSAQRHDAWNHAQGTRAQIANHHDEHVNANNKDKGENIMQHKGKDNTDVETTASLTATVTATDEHSDQYSHHMDNSQELSHADEQLRLIEAASAHQNMEHDEDEAAEHYDDEHHHGHHAPLDGTHGDLHHDLHHDGHHEDLHHVSAHPEELNRFDFDDHHDGHHGHDGFEHDHDHGHHDHDHGEFDMGDIHDGHHGHHGHDDHHFH